MNCIPIVDAARIIQHAHCQIKHPVLLLVRLMTIHFIGTTPYAKEVMSFWCRKVSLEEVLIRLGKDVCLALFFFKKKLI